MPCNVDATMREFIFDHGGRIAADGMIVITKDRFDQLQYTGRSIKDPNVRTWMLPDNFGLNLILEGKHFIVEEHPGDYERISRSDYSEEDLMIMWDYFEDVPMNPETEQIEAPFYHFPAGTSRMKIWEWFDARWPRGVYNLIYEGGKP